MRSDCAARPAYAARWLVIVETQRDRARHARSGWPLRRRARTGAPAATRIERARLSGSVCSAACRRPARRICARRQRRRALPSRFVLGRSSGRAHFCAHIQIHEAPHQPRAMGAAPFDQEGVRTRARDVVRDGIVQGYFLSTYSARKLGMQTTGNAGGAHQLALRSAHTRDKDDLRAMLKKLDTGLLLTEVM